MPTSSSSASSMASDVYVPCPISTIGITSVTTPCRSMPMKAFGAKRDDAPACAEAEPNTDGKATLRMRPPPKAALALRKLRRPTKGASELLDMVDPRSASGTMNSGADARVGATAADIAGHGGINIGIGRLQLVVQQRRSRHDLPGLAIATLHHLKVEPSLLKLLARRRLADSLDRGDGAVADAVDGGDAGSRRRAIDMDAVGRSVDFDGEGHAFSRVMGA